MKPDREAIGAALDKRLDLEALYLCGPFDKSGEPCSPDIHILAVTRDDLIRDFHFLPGVAAFTRRVEASAVPLNIAKSAVEHGASSWFTFYTLDKLRNARPIRESAEAMRLRNLALGKPKIRHSFHAEAIRGLLPGDAWPADPWPADSFPKDSRPADSRRIGSLALAALRLTGRLLAAIALSVIAEGKRTFSKNSDLLADRSLVQASLFESKDRKAGAARALESGRVVIACALKSVGIDLARLGPADTCPGGTA